MNLEHTAHYMHTGETAEARSLVRQFHYSGRFPSNVQLCATWHEPGGLFGDSGRAVAAVIFSIPPTRWSEPVWELSRLVRRDDVHCPLTGLISSAVKYIKSTGRMDLLISFADWTQGHHGGIYQASSWNYAGKRNPQMDGVVVEGVFVPGRSANSRWGTRSPEKLRVLGVDAEPHMDEGKHLYWKPLRRSGAKKAERLGFDCLPYPRPNEKAA